MSLLGRCLAVLHIDVNREGDLHVLNLSSFLVVLEFERRALDLLCKQATARFFFS
jgi:hypothetical protein